MNYQPAQTSRRRFLAVGGGTLLAGLGSTTAGSIAARAEPSQGAQEPLCVFKDNLGPGNVGFAVMGSLAINGKFYLGSRNLNPCVLAEYDPISEEVTANTHLPSAGAGQGITHTDPETLYVGLAFSGSDPNFFRYDIPTRQITRLPDVPMNSVRDLAAAPDGKVYICGHPASAGVFEYDPPTDRLVKLGVTQSGGQVRSIAATDETIFAGGRTGETRGTLVAMDRASGAMQEILPEEVRENASMVYALEISGRQLFVGTEGLSSGKGQLAIIDLDDYSSYRVVTPSGAKLVEAIEIVGSNVYLVSRQEGTLWAYDLDTGQLTELAVPMPYFEAWGLFSLDESSLIGAASGFVWTHDIQSGQTAKRDLVAAGAAAGAEVGQSIAASDEHVYVGGNWGVGVRDVDTGAFVERVAIPGEAKDMIVVDGELFLSAYNSLGIWRYRPGESPRLAALPPVDQNRPRAIRYDSDNELFLVVISADGEADPDSLTTYDPKTDRIRVFADPFGSGQRVSGVTSRQGIAYVGGESGLLAAIEPLTGEKLWQEIPVSGHDLLSSLVATGPYLYGIMGDGAFFVYHVERRTVVHYSEELRPAQGDSRLAMGGLGEMSRIFGATGTTLFTIDPATFAVRILERDLDSSWFSGPRLAVHRHPVEDSVYVLQDRDVLRVDVRRGGC